MARIPENTGVHLSRCWEIHLDHKEDPEASGGNRLTGLGSVGFDKTHETLEETSSWKLRHYLLHFFLGAGAFP
ncbi:hypothetical protein MPNT_20144 [Candidatus Methylacidithermus pantelleriae]|uniref:Uncharacterized protein n=1 Tax=Candidatus Methylacidithermus pantelleriae TaxID=2744239 RepID=A0A8J2BKH9_9BACT|nr:hypothetical protein MPNT_20144 [Candidatus Methylacidithermus pantelleriae]